MPTGAWAGWWAAGAQERRADTLSRQQQGRPSCFHFASEEEKSTGAVPSTGSGLASQLWLTWRGLSGCKQMEWAGRGADGWGEAMPKVRGSWLPGVGPWLGAK